MASGKSKVAEQLATTLGFTFFDIDKAIVEKEKRTVSDIFLENGEEYFRLIEMKTLHETAKLENAVIATGGGLPVHSDNMAWMNSHGITVYLEANTGLLFHRLLQNRGERPLLQGLGDIELMEKISSHLAERIPFYTMAKITFPASSVNLKQLVNKIKEVDRST